MQDLNGLDDASGKRKKKKSKRRKSAFTTKDEFVRVIRVIRYGVMYVATNHGFLYQVHLSTDDGTWRWLKCHADEGRSPLMSMCVEQREECDVIALANLEGEIVVLRVADNTFATHTVASIVRASEPRLLMDVFMTKGNVFASIVGGMMKCFPLDHDDSVEECAFTLTNPYSHRILAVDYCTKEKIVLVGDQKGNMCVFDAKVKSINLPVIAQKWSAHEKTASINVCAICDGPVFVTGGRDANVYTWRMKTHGEIELVPTSKWTTPSKASVLFATLKENGDLSHVAGFRETDFVVHSTVDQRQILRVECGTHIMPHDILMGEGGRIIFAYRDNDCLRISTRWPESQEVVETSTSVWSHG